MLLIYLEESIHNNIYSSIESYEFNFIHVKWLTYLYKMADRIAKNIIFAHGTHY